MPIFEYRCQQCEKEFETLVRGKEKPECPSCNSRKLEKLLSSFAAMTGGSRPSASESMAAGCGRCGDPRGPGACSMN